MFEIGDEVEIMGKPGDTHAGKHGKIVHVNLQNRVSRQGITNIPSKIKTGPLYGVQLNSEKAVLYLREKQLRKI